VLVVSANDDDYEQYEPADDICEKCNCTNASETSADGGESENGTVFTIDCSLKEFQHIFAKWPESMGDNHNG
jgi:hypothetical protein